MMFSVCKRPDGEGRHYDLPSLIFSTLFERFTLCFEEIGENSG